MQSEFNDISNTFIISINDMWRQLINNTPTVFIPVGDGAYLSAVCAIFLWIFHWGVYKPNPIVSWPPKSSAEEEFGVFTATMFIDECHT